MSLRKHLLALGSVIAILGSLVGPMAAIAAPAITPAQDGTFFIGWPDLIPQSIWVDRLARLDPHDPNSGWIGPLSVYVTVKNQGTLGAVASTTQAKFFKAGKPDYVKHAATPILGVGRSTMVTFTVPDGYEGGTVRITVDKGAANWEAFWGERNNVKTVAD